MCVAETRKHNGTSIESLPVDDGSSSAHAQPQPCFPKLFGHGRSPLSHFHNTLDNVLRKLRSDGVGVPRQDEIVMKEDDEALWLSGQLTMETPKGLLRAVLFLNGKLFCLRGEEHRQLKISQVVQHKSSQVCAQNMHHGGGLGQLYVSKARLCNFWQYQRLVPNAMCKLLISKAFRSSIGS